LSSSKNDPTKELKDSRKVPKQLSIAKLRERKAGQETEAIELEKEMIESGLTSLIRDEKREQTRAFVDRLYARATSASNAQQSLPRKDVHDRHASLSNTQPSSVASAAGGRPLSNVDFQTFLLALAVQMGSSETGAPVLNIHPPESDPRESLMRAPRSRPPPKMHLQSRSHDVRDNRR
jgi:hypothetical protein